MPPGSMAWLGIQNFNLPLHELHVGMWMMMYTRGNLAFNHIWMQKSCYFGSVQTCQLSHAIYYLVSCVKIQHLGPYACAGTWAHDESHYLRWQL